MATPKKPAHLKQKTGRKTALTPELRGRILLLATHQLTNEQICQTLDIASASFYSWQQNFPEFLEAIKAAREQRLDDIERNMYLRGNGVKFDETTEEFERIVEKNEKGAITRDEFVLTKRKVAKKWLAPDVGAAVFILCNRRPRFWRNIQKVDIEAKGETMESLLALMKMAGEARKKNNDSENKKAHRRGLGTAEILN